MTGQQGKEVFQTRLTHICFNIDVSLEIWWAVVLAWPMQIQKLLPCWPRAQMGLNWTASNGWLLSVISMDVLQFTPLCVGFRDPSSPGILEILEFKKSCSKSGQFWRVYDKCCLNVQEQSKTSHLECNMIILTHLGRVMHTCVSKLTIIGSDNGLSPGQHQAIIWTNARILLFGPFSLRNKLKWDFNRNSDIFIQGNALENVVWKMFTNRSLPQCVK